MLRASGEEAIVEGARFIDWLGMDRERFGTERVWNKIFRICCAPLALHCARVDRRGRNEAHEHEGVPGSGIGADGAGEPPDDGAWQLSAGTVGM